MHDMLAPTTGLYAHFLGERWSKLAPSVQRLHAAGGIRAVGTFRVRRGNRLARLLAWIGRLPAECENVALRLTVTPSPGREQWQRLFGASPFHTLQWADRGCLVERVGLSETHLQLDVVDGALHYSTKRVAVRLGPLRLPLPRWLAPRITASEAPDGEAVRIHVEVTLPLIGLLVGYDGVLTSIEPVGSVESSRHCACKE